MGNIRIRDGFTGQIMHVIPRPLLTHASSSMLPRGLYATMIGWFPHARHHYIDRPEGSDAHILIYCISGKGWFEIDGIRGPIAPDEALLIPRGKPHTYGADSKDPWSIHWAHFTGEDADLFAQLMPLSEHSINVSQSIREKLETLFRDCYRFFDYGHTPKSILLCSQTLRHLLALMFFDNPSFSVGMTRARHKSFAQIIEFMRSNLDGNLTLDAMAKKAALSSTRFSVVFKKQTGFSPVDYYIRLRIQAACRLFDTTPLNVAEVAMNIGYNDPCYFSRVFKKIMGISPATYRDQHRQTAP